MLALTPKVLAAAIAAYFASTAAGSGTTARTACPAPSAGSHVSPSAPRLPAPPVGSPARNRRHKTVPTPRTRQPFETPPCALPSRHPAQTSSPPACPPPARRRSSPHSFPQHP